MHTILIANPKGGSGKTTLSTNVAGYLASSGRAAVMCDLDRQKSATEWLGLRPAELPLIRALDTREDGELKSGRNSDWLVIDSPAGLHGKNLAHALKPSRRVLVPLQPSLFDMAATRDFLALLAEEKAVRKEKTLVGIVGMRVDARTRAAATLEAFLGQFDLPVLAFLRDTVVYANAAFNGMSIFDLPRHVGERDVEQWQPIVEWIDATGKHD
ncbi:MAG: ParA family protein [Proteobacteria bacterium]|nr:ParA family protein [Burkholderiales bacterium]